MRTPDLRQGSGELLEQHRRDIEALDRRIEVRARDLDALGIGFVAYSPLGRGFLSGTIPSRDSLIENDRRRDHPRFSDEAIAANIALVESLGFQREGTFREFIHRDGQRYDMLLYGLLRREWAATASHLHAPDRRAGRDLLDPHDSVGRRE